MKGMRQATFAKIVASQADLRAKADSALQGVPLCRVCGRPVQSYPNLECEDCWIRRTSRLYLFNAINRHRRYT